MPSNKFNYTVKSIEKIKKFVQKIHRKKPLISIIMPVYNGEKYLRQSIDSILNQTSDNYELLIVNNNSTDNTGKIIEEYACGSKKIKPLFCINKGVSNARNMGIDMAKGDYICFLDADDIYEKNVIEERTKYVMEHNAPVTTTNWIMTNGDMETMITSKAREIAFSDFFQCPVNSDSVMFRSDIIKKVKFDPSFSNGEDWLTWARIARMGYTYMPITDCTVYYVQRNSTVRQDFYKHTIGLLKVLDIMYSKDEKFLFSVSKYKNGLTEPDLNIIKTERTINLYFYELLSDGKKYNDARNLLSEYKLNAIKEERILGLFNAALRRVFLNNHTEIQFFAANCFDNYRDDIIHLFNEEIDNKIFMKLEGRIPCH